MPALIDPEIARRVAALELPFNAAGIDPYGISRDALARAMTVLAFFYRRYFRVAARGIAHVPARGRAMLVGNHAGGVALDGAMVLAAAFLEMDPPRLAQGMAEKFINRLPFASAWAGRTGQFTGLPEHALRLLEDDRLVLVFPEGARGTAKLFSERNTLVEFGTGFMRLALKARAPVVPFGFVGGGEAIPTVFNAERLGRWLGVPYVPLTPYVVPLPLPVPLAVRFGPPLTFAGTGAEDDAVIQGYVDQVRAAIADLMARAREAVA